MKGSIEERAQDLALYIIEHKATVRAAAVAFGVSKSTVHMDLPKRNGIYGRFAEYNHNILWCLREQAKKEQAKRMPAPLFVCAGHRAQFRRLNVLLRALTVRYLFVQVMSL